MSFISKILDAFKMESTREMEKAAGGFVPDAQTAYFINGKLCKLYPSDLDNWYDVRYLVSDNVVYD